MCNYEVGVNIDTDGYDAICVRYLIPIHLPLFIPGFNIDTCRTLVFYRALKVDDNCAILPGGQSTRQVVSFAFRVFV